MVTSYRDLSGNNPTNHLMDRATMHDAPAVEFSAIIDPSSVDQDFPKFARAVYLNVLGNLEVVDKRGNSTVFVGLAAGQILDVQCGGTKAAGSTTTAIVPLY